MNTPIIDPSTLTEEQRKIIKEQHEINSNLTCSEIQNAFQIGCVQTFEWLFGKDFFLRKENEIPYPIFTLADLLGILPSDVSPQG